MNQKNKIIFLSSVIIGVLILTLEVTFAIFNFNKTSTNSKLIVGDIYMHYNETNQISLENAMPNNPYIVNSVMSTQEYTEGGSNELSKCVDILLVSQTGIDSTSAESLCKDDVGLQQAYDEGSLDQFNLTNKFIRNNILILNSSMPYFEFTIDGKNTTKDKDIWYEIVLSYGDNHPTRTTRIRDDLLKFRLVETKDGVETTVVDNKSYSDLNNHRIWVDTINKNTTTEVTHTYRLYMWISNDTIIGNVNQDYTMEEWNDVYASIKVNVTGDFNEKTISIDESCFTVGTINDGNEVAILDYDESCGSDVIIPSTIKGYPVTVIGNSETSIIQRLNNKQSNSHFNNLNYYNKKYDLEGMKGGGPTGPTGSFSRKDLTSVTIPDSVTTIEFVAFSGNQLTSVTIPDSVTTIGDSAFASNQLTSVIIGNSVTTIGEGAFNYNLLPNDQAFIYARTDNNSDGIAEIDNTIIISYGGANKQPIIPDNVTTIGDSAFASNQLTSVTIPNSVTTIGWAAFSYNQLTSVTIPNSVTTIGARAFSDNQLTSVTIGSGIQYISWGAFYKYSSSNPNLSSITINRSCSDIKNIPRSSTNSDKYYPWLSDSSPYTASGVTIYGTGGDVCDSY